MKKTVVVRDIWKNGHWQFPISLSVSMERIKDYVVNNFQLCDNKLDCILRILDIKKRFV